MMKIDVSLDERAIVHVDGRPARYLAPGRHRLWAWRKNILVRRLKTSDLVVDLAAEELALVPAHEILLVSLGDDERAIVRRRGRATKWLGKGDHVVWRVDKIERRDDIGLRVQIHAVDVEIVDTSAIDAKPLRDDVKALVPSGDYAEVTVQNGAVALRMVDGALDRVLGPGRHAAWTTQRKVAYAVLDLRERIVAVTGQDVMTKDKVTLRLNASASYKVADAARLATVARDAEAALYLAMQLALREAVAVRSLDEMLASRDELATSVTPAIAGTAAKLGLELLSFGVKDVILPGEMKTLLNRVIEAQKEAEANVILRREETAATRSMAQTAKVLAENPLLVRLKELEAYKELAAKVGQVHVVLGDAAMSKLELKA